MSLVQGHGRSSWERLSVVLFDFFLTLKSEFSDQPTRPPTRKLSIAIIPDATLAILKYNVEDLQQILKTT